MSKTRVYHWNLGITSFLREQNLVDGSNRFLLSLPFPIVRNREYALAIEDRLPWEELVSRVLMALFIGLQENDLKKFEVDLNFGKCTR
jgi:hypothetical protein